MLRCYMVTCAIGWLFCCRLITVLFVFRTQFQRFIRIEMSLLSSFVDHQYLGSGKQQILGTVFATAKHMSTTSIQS